MSHHQSDETSMDELPVPYSPLEDMQVLEQCLERECELLQALIHETLKAPDPIDSAMLDAQQAMILTHRNNFNHMQAKLLGLELDISGFDRGLARLDQLIKIFFEVASLRSRV